MLYENLAKMSRPELLAFANSQGVKIRKNFKNETIIKEIMHHVAPAVTPKKAEPRVLEETITPYMAKKLKEAEEAKNNTPEMIERAIAAIKARVPDFKSEYTDTTWSFSCKGAMDSGNIFIPIRLIVKSAGVVSRGRLALMTRTEFDHMTSTTGKNGYTNTVLA